MTHKPFPPPLALAYLCRHVYTDEVDPEFIQSWLSASRRPHVFHVVGGDIRATIIATGSFVVVVFRGTVLHDLRSVRRNFQTDPMPEDFYAVHQGFADGLDQVFHRVTEYLIDLQGFLRPLIITGHSQGGALATLAAVRWYNVFADRDDDYTTAERIRPSCLTTFGSPRVGDWRFAWSALQMFQSGTLVKRITNTNDLMVRLPGLFYGYEHGIPETYLSRSGEVRFAPALPWRLWDSLVERLKTRTLFDSFEAHKIDAYVDKLERGTLWRGR